MRAEKRKLKADQLSDFETQSLLTHKVLTYFAAIDDKQLTLELFQRLFAENAVSMRPSGPVTGPSAIFESQNASFKRFRATQHIVTNLLYSKIETGWKLRANVQAMHLWSPEMQDSTSLDTYFLAHSVLGVNFVQEESDWKIAEFAIKVVWRSGSGMMAMANTGHER